MEIQDFAEPEIAITAAVAAAIFSPRARKVARKGLVYGMAGVLAAGDVVTSFARSVGQGVHQASEAANRVIQEENEPEAQAGAVAEAEKEPEVATASKRKTSKAESAKAEEKAGGK